MRINIDQETLFFLIDFCTSFIPQNDKIIHPSHSSNSISIESNTTVRYSHGVETIEIQPDEVAIEVTEDQEQANENYPTGKKHALKMYDQFAINTCCFGVPDQILHQLCNFTKFLLQNTPENLKKPRPKKTR